MTFAHLRTALAAAALLFMVNAPALAQRGPSPEQQIFALQQQLAASQAAAVRLEQRLGAIERQMQQIVNSSETNAHRVNMLDSTLNQLRADQEARMTAFERRAPAAEPAPAASVEPDSTPEPAPPSTRPADPRPAVAASEGASDAGEDAYTEGFNLWEERRYDAAVTALRAFTSAFPTHRRVSWANNLSGRALLDKGEPRAAAEVLLANYRSNPSGGRAQDSLYYLGQALIKLRQPEQACKAYAELASVYGSAVRAELQALVARARAEANCS